MLTFTIEHEGDNNIEIKVTRAASSIPESRGGGICTLMANGVIIDTANSICSDAEDLIDKMLELGRDRGLLKEPDDQKQSRTYKKCLNIDKLTSKQLSDLKEKVVEVHLNIWIPLHCNLDFAFNTMDGQYPYFIYDDDDWCLATEPKGKVVDFDDFISMLEKQGKENNE